MVSLLGERILGFKIGHEIKDNLHSNIFFNAKLLDYINNNLVVVDRATAEEDLRYKQLVVYILIRSGELYASYRRTSKTGESRLKNNYSIGFGGHVSSEDGQQTALWDFPRPIGDVSLDRDRPSGEPRLISILSNAMWRELMEEIKINPKHVENTELIQFINDDTTDVGQVHFGIIWLIDLNKPQIKLKGERGIGELEFLSINDMSKYIDRYERWSRFLIHHLIDSDGIINRRND